MSIDIHPQDKGFMKGIHIFKPGKQTSSQGITLDFSDDTLKATVDAYSPDLHEAPIVIGHPKDNGPAWGWVNGLEFSNDGLVANPQQVDPQFEEMVQAGRFKKVSASFYAPDSASNPVPGVYYLRHVGFLGAQPPAVKGLKGVEFSEDDEVIEFSAPWDTSNIAGLFRKLREFLIDKFSKEEADNVLPTWSIEDLEDSARRAMNEDSNTPSSAFSEQNSPSQQPPEGNAMTEEELKQLKADLEAKEQSLKDREASFSEKETAIKASEAALRQQEIASDLDALVKAGKVLPAQKERLAEFMASLDNEKDVLEFGEGEQKKSFSQQAFMKEFLGKLPKAVDFKEHAADDQEQPPENSNELAQKALEYQEEQRKKGRTVSITQAVNAVQKGTAKS
ncbi:hypothetical protein [Endozoicomonas acroporae]|uniref:hypothetical protein n=1 Tax=Endozoicomonas acroporae TaxID=1701104 RepID=UPI003D79E2CD